AGQRQPRPGPLCRGRAGDGAGPAARRQRAPGRDRDADSRLPHALVADPPGGHLRRQRLPGADAGLVPRCRRRGGRGRRRAAAAGRPVPGAGAAPGAAGHAGRWRAGAATHAGAAEDGDRAICRRTLRQPQYPRRPGRAAPVAAACLDRPVGTVMTESFPTRISVQQALELLRSAALARPRATEAVATRRADGRVLAADVVAPVALPAFDNSAMDGFAVRHADLSADAPAWLELAGEQFAGPELGLAVGPGQCVRVTTGAPMPAGADTVVIR